MTETKNFYQQFGFHPETIGLRHRYFNIIVEPDEMDQQGGAQAGDICVRARDGAANPMDFEAVRKPNFINTLEDDFDPTYRYYWFRPLSEPMTETKDDVAGLVARLRKAAEHAGVLLVDPPKPSPMMALLNEAADALTPAPTEAGGVGEAAVDLLSHLKLHVMDKLGSDDADALHDCMLDLTAALACLKPGSRFTVDGVECVVVRKDALDWLNGEGDSFERPDNVRGNFWWRGEFRRRAMLRACEEKS